MSDCYFGDLDGESAEIMGRYVRGYSAYKIGLKMGLERQRVRGVIHSVYVSLSEDQKKHVDTCHAENEKFIKTFSIKNVSPDDAECLYELLAPMVVDMVIERHGGRESVHDMDVNTTHIADMIWDQFVEEGEIEIGSKSWMNGVTFREMTRKILNNIGFTQRWSQSNRHVLIWGGSMNPAMREKFPELKSLVCQAGN